MSKPYTLSSAQGGMEDGVLVTDREELRRQGRLIEELNIRLSVAQRDVQKARKARVVIKNIRSALHGLDL